MTEVNRPISRRRLLAGAGAGAAAVWAAPSITTLASASAAGSCITIYQTLLGELKGQPTTYVAAYTLTFSNGDHLYLTAGSANLTGPNSQFQAPAYPSVACLDLNGEGQGGLTTVLETDTIPPGTYTVELSIGGTFPTSYNDTNNTISVTLGGNTIFNTALGPGVAISTFTSSVTIASAAPLTITFVDQANDDVGMFLAGIRICKTN